MEKDPKLRALRRRIAQRRVASRGPRRIVPSSFVTTADLFPGCRIAESLGVVTAEVVRVGDIVSNIAIDLRDGWGGRSKAFEEMLGTARAECLNELQRRAYGLGANGLVAVKVDVEAPAKHVLLIIGTGTAVVLEGADAARETDGGAHDSAAMSEDAAGGDATGSSGEGSASAPDSPMDNELTAEQREVLERLAQLEGSEWVERHRSVILAQLDQLGLA